MAGSPTTYGQTSTVATAVTAAVDAFVDALNILTEARANGVRSEQQTAQKNSLRLSMLNILRPIYASVQESTTISDAEKIAIGVHIKDTHNTPAPLIDFAPLLSVVKVDGNIVNLRAVNPNEPASNRKPDYCDGIAVFSYVGAEPSSDPADYTFQGNTGRIEIAVEFPSTVTTGATVWFTAFYFNTRKQSGPGCTPVSATLGAGSVMPPMLRIAA